MKMLHSAIGAVLLSFAAFASAQMAGMQMPATPPPASTGPASEVLRSYSTLKPNVIKAAEKMPDADYQYKPTPDIRTFARIVNHITEAQAHTCTALNGTKFDAKMVPSDTADKATIVAALKASFDECDTAYNALTDANATELLAYGRGQNSRAGRLAYNSAHDQECYGSMSVYMRIKGIVPPSTAARAGRGGPGR